MPWRRPTATVRSLVADEQPPAAAAHYVNNRTDRESDLTRFYDQQAPDRAGFPAPTRRDEHRSRFFDRLPNDARVLEIGTGVGADARAMANNGFDVTGIDLSMENLHATGSMIQRARASAIDLPFADRSFDAVWSMSTLMHIPDAEVLEALQECRRVLRRGGLAGFGTWGGNDQNHIVENDHYEPARFFALRSDATWKQSIETTASILEWETWTVRDLPDHYQWAVAEFSS